MEAKEVRQLGIKPIRLGLGVLLIFTLSFSFSSGVAASQQDQASSSWQSELKWVLSNETSNAPTVVAQSALETAEQVNAILRGHEDHWAETYVDDDLRTVVVNVKTGHEQAVAAQIAQVRAIASAPVRIRLVEHSSNELMARAEPLDAFTYFAGSRYTSARVDQELNSLVVGIDKVTLEAVRAVQDATGEGTYVEQGNLATFASGPERWKDRYPYSGGAGYRQVTSTGAGAGPSCTTAFAMRRPADGRHLMLTAGHCLNNSGIPGAAYTNPASLNGDGSAWNNALGSTIGYPNTLTAGGDSASFGGDFSGDLQVWSESGGSATAWFGDRRATTLTTIRSTQTAPPVVGDILCKSGATGGTSCSWQVQDDNVTQIVCFNQSGTLCGEVQPLVRVHSTNTTDCIVPGDSGGAFMKQVTGGMRASGVTSAFDDSGTFCRGWFTSIAEAADFYNASVIVNP